MLPLTFVRHPLNFYLVQAFAFLFVCSIGLYVSWQSAEEINSPAVKRSNYLMLAAGLGLVYIAFHMVVKYFKNTPIITLDSSEIKFNKRASFKISEIEDIKLTGKVPFPMLLNFPMEGTAIRFKNGETKFIYDDLYSNTWQLKSLLQQTVSNEAPYTAETYEANSDVQLFDIEVFQGNPVFSFRGLMLWSFIGFIIYITWTGPKFPDPKVIFVFTGISILLFLGISNSMNYFGLSDEYLIVKNHHFIWKRHLYKLGDIREIVFETQPKAPYSLRIISKNFHTKLYGAGTLRDEQWFQLMQRLKTKGVLVRDELNLKPNSGPG